jgi:hypothetical protein
MQKVISLSDLRSTRTDLTEPVRPQRGSGGLSPRPAARSELVGKRRYTPSLDTYAAGHVSNQLPDLGDG